MGFKTHDSSLQIQNLLFHIYTEYPALNGNKIKHRISDMKADKL